ncbi:MAG TPA: transketolase [Bacteriovoracaceae bacterium]|nr:transketolase [Bacteriovoracaceae bacterium]
MKFNPAKIRTTILDMAHSGQTVHVACAFSIVEIAAVLYRSVLDLGDGTVGCQKRDKLILSKGHGVMALYACLEELGWLDKKTIIDYFQDGSELKGLSECNVPGLEVSSGSLGHGLSVAVGLALAAKKKGSDRKIYCIVGDGEMNEGAIWEGILFAAHFKLDNFILVVDENKYQAMGTTKEVMDMGNIKSKLDAFGFFTLEANGHNEADLLDKFQKLLKNTEGKPKALVADTVKGYGVSFMHANNAWHYSRLTDETHKAAVNELKQGQKS